MDKLKLRQAIVVEGKYDQNTLRQLVDTAIFTTNGFTGMKDRHGLYAVIGKDENRDKEVRRPRASIRRQLSETKQAQAPKKAPARTKKNELEV